MVQPTRHAVSNPLLSSCARLRSSIHHHPPTALPLPVIRPHRLSRSIVPHIAVSLIAVSLLAVALCANASYAQEIPVRPDFFRFASAAPSPQADESPVPEADPARPTVTNPAHIPPVGYVQFEQGVLFATATPAGVERQTSVDQSAKLSVHPRLMLQILSQPFASTRISSAPGPAISTRDPGDLLLGAQGLLVFASGLRPTVALGYNRRVRTGSAPDLDIGSYSQSANLLVSGDLHGFHYDSNFGLSQQQAQADGSSPPIRRAQYNQSLSVNHSLFSRDFELTGELWHFTQPLVTTTSSGSPSSRSNAVGALAALGYSLRPNLVLDAGLNHGLTSTSTDWEGFAGFTYLLPHRLWPQAGEAASHHRLRTPHEASH